MKRSRKRAFMKLCLVVFFFFFLLADRVTVCNSSSAMQLLFPPCISCFIKHGNVSPRKIHQAPGKTCMLPSTALTHGSY